MPPKKKKKPRAALTQVASPTKQPASNRDAAVAVPPASNNLIGIAGLLVSVCGIGVAWAIFALSRPHPKPDVKIESLTGEYFEGAIFAPANGKPVDLYATLKNFGDATAYDFHAGAYIFHVPAPDDMLANSTAEMSLDAEHRLDPAGDISPQQTLNAFTRQMANDYFGPEMDPRINPKQPTFYARVRAEYRDNAGKSHHFKVTYRLREIGFRVMGGFPVATHSD